MNLQRNKGDALERGWLCNYCIQQYPDSLTISHWFRSSCPQWGTEQQPVKLSGWSWVGEKQSRAQRFCWMRVQSHPGGRGLLAWANVHAIVLLRGCVDLEVDLGGVNSLAWDWISSAVSNKQVVFFIRLGRSGGTSVGAGQWLWAGHHTMGLGNVCLSSSYPYSKTNKEIGLVVLPDAFMSLVVIVAESGWPQLSKTGRTTG